MYPMATSFIIDRIEYTTEKKTKLQYMPKRLQPLYVLEVELERIYLLTNKKKTLYFVSVNFSIIRNFGSDFKVQGKILQFFFI